MSTYTCPHCGERGLSTQKRHNCPEAPSLSIPLGPPRARDPIAAEYIDRLTRKLKEAWRERSAARAEALTAQASLRRVERELEEARNHARRVVVALRAIRDEAAIGGPPLESRREDWEAALREADEVLGELEALYGE